MLLQLYFCGMHSTANVYTSDVAKEEGVFPRSWVVMVKGFTGVGP